MNRLLIANRGEIARRIARTTTAMGIRTVAVYTAAERDAPFVSDTDEAILLDGHGPAPYLDAAGLVEAARRAGADAVHPGYGFLAENAGFARAVVDAGLIWVGPTADAIERMGDKLAAKRAAEEAGVPVLASTEVDDSVELPALVKAAYGGGGKGMRVVRAGEDLEAAVAAARREAERAFGDGTLFVEPFLESVRHVEIQVLGDAHGNVVHLGERECSIQRRHQKVVEEAPSPVVSPELRDRMGEAAVSLARAISYRNAGTVEFLLADDGRFFFLEMNTRLQVEHPVTEEVTGVDLVREQLLEASGEPIDVTTIADPDGHAIEVRLNSEDPANDFLPATGTLHAWSPAHGVRFESGVEAGSVISTDFDPLIAKVIAHGATRQEAAAALALALERTAIHGVVTNRDLLVAILRSEEFASGDTTTDFLERVSPPSRRRLTEDEQTAALTAVVLHAEDAARASARVLRTHPPGWRNSIMPAQRRILAVGDEEMTVHYHRRDGVLQVDAGSGERTVVVGRDSVELDGRSVPTSVSRAGASSWVHGPWGDVEVMERSPFPTSEVEEASGSLVAPMPGSVVSVAVAVGDAVRKGQTLIVLEAMKMEHPIGSPEAGTVSEVNVAAGDQVDRGALLAVVAETEEAGG